MRLVSALFLLILCGGVAAAPATVYLEELTWTELREAIDAGTTTVIIPIGGTEQSGPQIALGKHNARVRVLAGKIATALGHTVVAPVLAYVPEGSISPPAAHMRFAGTISISDEAFRATLESASRSLRQHGFRDVVLIGDHGGYQGQLEAVARRLNRDWAGTPARAHYIATYYRSADADYAAVLRAKGLTPAQIGSHAGTADTSLQLAVEPAMVRPEQFGRAAREGQAVGVAGDPRPATSALGQTGVDLIVSQSVAAIRSAVAERR